MLASENPAQGFGVEGSGLRVEGGLGAHWVARGVSETLKDHHTGQPQNFIPKPKPKPYTLSPKP